MDIIEPIGRSEGGAFSRVGLLLRGMRTFKDWHVWLGERAGFRMKHGKFRIRDGTIFFVNPTEGDQIAAFQEVYLQKRYTRYYAPQGDDCVVDIGAAVGEFSIFAASRSAGIRVYAYEPASSPFKRLERAIEVNGMKARVHAHRLAVSDKKGPLTIEDKGNIFFNDSSFEAEATTLEEIFRENKISHCNFLKVDIEGAEFDVLMKAPKNIYGKISHIALEYHRDPRDLIHFLKQQGYAVNAFSSSNDCGYIYADK